MQRHPQHAAVQNRLDDAGDRGVPREGGEKRARVERVRNVAAAPRERRRILRVRAELARDGAPLRRDELRVVLGVAAGVGMGRASSSSSARALLDPRPAFGDVREGDVFVAEVDLAEVARARGAGGGAVDPEGHALADELAAQTLAGGVGERLVLTRAVAPGLEASRTRGGERSMR